MNTRRRVGKLEARSGLGFRVAAPRLLDKNRNTFDGSPKDNEVAGVRYCIDGESLELWREGEEDLREFERRAQELFAPQLKPTVILPFGTEFL